MHVVGLCGTNRTLATWAREALVIPTKKNYKGEQLHWEEERIKHTNRKFRDPRVESKGMGESQLKEGPIERRRGMIRGEESIRQLEVSEASSAASSRKKEGTAIVSWEIDRVKSQYQSDDEQVKGRALGSRCKLNASGGLENHPPAVCRGLQHPEGRGLQELPHLP